MGPRQPRVVLSQAELREQQKETEDKEKEDRPKPLQRPTQRDYDRGLMEWENYKNRIGEPNLEPSTAAVKAMIEMMVIERYGMISDRLAVQTLENYVLQIKRSCERTHKTVFHPTFLKDVNSYIENELKQKYRLSNKMRPKPQMGSQDLEEVIKFIWAEDEHEFDYERIRVQLVFYLLLLAYTAARPGAIVVSDCYRDSEEALKYKDFEFVTIEENGQTEKFLMITFRNMKFDREDDSRNLTMIVAEDKEQPHLCPISLFLGMAFADNAFREISDPEDSHTFVNPTGRMITRHKFEDHVLEIPILRASASCKGTCPVLAWSYAGMYNALRKLGERMGYMTPPTSYALRRGAAFILNASTTWAEIGQIMGHSSPKILTSYLSSTPWVNLQGLYAHEATNTRHFELLHRLEIDRYRGAPTHLPEEMRQEINKSPEIMKLRLEYKDKTPSEKQEVRRVIRVKLAGMRMKALAQLRNEYFEKGGAPAPHNPTELSCHHVRKSIIETLYFSPDFEPRQRLLSLTSLYTEICKLGKTAGLGQRKRSKRFREKKPSWQNHLHPFGKSDLSDEQTPIFTCVSRVGPVIPECPSSEFTWSHLQPLPNRKYTRCIYSDCEGHKTGMKKRNIMRHYIHNHSSTRRSQLCTSGRCSVHSTPGEITAMHIQHNDKQFLVEWLNLGLNHDLKYVCEDVVEPPGGVVDWNYLKWHADNHKRILKAVVEQGQSLVDDIVLSRANYQPFDDY